MQKKQRLAIARFQNFCFDPVRFIPLTIDHLTEAANLWGQIRRAGLATAERHALDGDAILAAQVLSLNLPAGQFIVATRNASHLTRFGLPADEWQNISP